MSVDGTSLSPEERREVVVSGDTVTFPFHGNTKSLRMYVNEMMRPPTGDSPAVEFHFELQTLTPEDDIEVPGPEKLALVHPGAEAI
jgi:hypothetical protein